MSSNLMFLRQQEFCQVIIQPDQTGRNVRQNVPFVIGIVQMCSSTGCKLQADPDYFDFTTIRFHVRTAEGMSREETGTFS